MAIQQCFSIGLLNPKNPTNVASVLRAVGCYQGSSVFYTGQRYARAKAFNADTQAMHKVIPTVGVPDLQQAKPKGARTVVVELVEGAQPLPHYEHPDNAFYIFGPEDGSVTNEILRWADDVVYIPTKGCMNLAATVNVVLYDRLAKSNFEASDETIRASRDTNNRTRIFRKTSC
ncbi:RNA methyltransferase [Alteromonas sp. 14N.309.X.WAT.G.H12]|uniref:RNA methyltransferase n=1 Tax=Alteromonas sp. 14N.309.X.WAT.G.H12 TaxID=3120824 RepID=UPI002FD56236